MKSHLEVEHMHQDHQEKGQSLLEYALIFILVVIIVIIVIYLFGPALSNLYRQIVEGI